MKLVFSGYVLNPFIIWGIFAVISSQINYISFIYDLREFVWINNLHLIFLYLAISYVGSRELIPLWDGLKKLSHSNALFAFFIILGIVLLIATESVFFLIGIMELVADQHSEIITDQEKFDSATLTAFVVSYFFIPLASFILIRSTRKQLENRTFQITKHLMDYPLGSLILMTLTFIFASIHVIVINNNLFR